MTRRIVKEMALLLALLGLLQSPALANSGRGEREHPGHSGPPPEAIEACRDKSDGDTMEFTTPNGDRVSAYGKRFGGRIATTPKGKLQGQG